METGPPQGERRDDGSLRSSRAEGDDAVGPGLLMNTVIELTLLVCTWPRPVRHLRSPLMLPYHPPSRS